MTEVGLFNGVPLLYRQLGRLAFFQPEILAKQLLSNCPALDWSFIKLSNFSKIPLATQQLVAGQAQMTEQVAFI